MKKVKKIIAGILLSTMVFNSGIIFSANAKNNYKAYPEQFMPKGLDKAKVTWKIAERANSEKCWERASKAWLEAANKYAEDEIIFKECLAFSFEAKANATWKEAEKINYSIYDSDRKKLKKEITTNKMSTATQFYKNAYNRKKINEQKEVAINKWNTAAQYYKNASKLYRNTNEADNAYERCRDLARAARSNSNNLFKPKNTKNIDDQEIKEAKADPKNFANKINFEIDNLIKNQGSIYSIQIAHIHEKAADIFNTVGKYGLATLYSLLAMETHAHLAYKKAEVKHTDENLEKAYTLLVRYFNIANQYFNGILVNISAKEKYYYIAERYSLLAKELYRIYTFKKVYKYASKAIYVNEKTATLYKLAENELYFEEHSLLAQSARANFAFDCAINYPTIENWKRAAKILETNKKIFNNMKNKNEYLITITDLNLKSAYRKISSLNLKTKPTPENENFFFNCTMDHADACFNTAHVIEREVTINNSSCQKMEKFIKDNYNKAGEGWKDVAKFLKESQDPEASPLQKYKNLMYIAVLYCKSAEAFKNAGDNDKVRLCNIKAREYQNRANNLLPEVANEKAGRTNPWFMKRKS